MLARFLRLLSCYGGSLSSPTSGADRPLPGAVASFRQVPDGVRESFRAGVRFFPVSPPPPFPGDRGHVGRAIDCRAGHQTRPFPFVATRTRHPPYDGQGAGYVRGSLTQKGPQRGICDKRKWHARKRAKLTFAAAKPPPSHVFTEAALPAAEESGGV